MNITFIDHSFPIVLAQSPYWWQSKNIDWFIENAEFAFSKKNAVSYKERRIWIKTGSPYNHNQSDVKLDFNCFEFDIDRYGFIIKSETFFEGNSFNEDEIIEKEFNVKRAFRKYLHREDIHGEDCLKFLDPSFITRLRNFKSKYVKIK